jgi:multicomponent K+:H+ antiporter subunit E
MSRWLPYPLVFLALLAMWLLLNRTLWPGQVALGAALALGLTRVFALLQRPQGRVRRGRSLVVLVWLVLVDIIRSNIAVARLVILRRSVKRVAGFVEMPLAVRHPGALAVMACILTATPGTSWARLDRHRNVLVIHVFDLIDEAQWMERFKERYERRLMEIFE